MVPGMKHLPYHTRLAQLGLWSLEERRHRSDLLEVFRMYKGLSLTPFCRYFTLSPVISTRGHSAKVRKNRCCMWLALQASMCSRMVSILWEEIRWASLWTDWSVWPYGLTCFWGFSGTGASAPGELPQACRYTLQNTVRVASAVKLNEYRRTAISSFYCVLYALRD